MEGMLKKSLVTKYLEECRQIAGNEQITIQLSNKEQATKYEPDRVQDYFTSEKETEEESEPLHLKMLTKQINSQFLTSSMWLKQ